MRVLTCLGALSAVAALALGVASPAAAALPPRALLTDSAGTGTTNGCIARAAPLSVSTTQEPSLVIKGTLKCEASAGVRWYSFSGSFAEVMPDGTLRGIYAPQLLGRSQTSEPLDTTAATSTIYPCATPGMGGTHTWLARWSMKTKHDKDDPNPFVAKVWREQTITCS